MLSDNSHLKDVLTGCEWEDTLEGTEGSGAIQMTQKGIEPWYRSTMVSIHNQSSRSFKILHNNASSAFLITTEILADFILTKTLCLKTSPMHSLHIINSLRIWSIWPSLMGMISVLTLICSLSFACADRLLLFERLFYDCFSSTFGLIR